MCLGHAPQVKYTKKTNHYLQLPFYWTVVNLLKHYLVTILLHIIKRCTGISASVVIPNKQPETTVKTFSKAEYLYLDHQTSSDR